MPSESFWRKHQCSEQMLMASYRAYDQGINALHKFSKTPKKRHELRSWEWEINPSSKITSNIICIICLWKVFVLYLANAPLVILLNAIISYYITNTIRYMEEVVSRQCLSKVTENFGNHCPPSALTLTSEAHEKLLDCSILNNSIIRVLKNDLLQKLITI